MTDTDDAAPRRAPSRWYIALPTITFVIGAALAGVLVGVSGVGDSGSSSGAAGGSGGGTTSPGTPGPSTAVVVPNSCLEASATVTKSVGLLQDAAQAVRDFDPDQLIDLLNQLQLLSDQAQAQAQTCTGTTVTGAGTPSSSPTATSPTASPSVSATPSPGAS